MLLRAAAKRRILAQKIDSAARLSLSGVCPEFGVRNGVVVGHSAILMGATMRRLKAFVG